MRMKCFVFLSVLRCFCAVLDACAMRAVLRETYVAPHRPCILRLLLIVESSRSDLRIATVHILSERSPNRDGTT